MRSLLCGFLVLACSGPLLAQQNPDGRLPLGYLEDPTVFLLRDEAVFRELQITTDQRTALHTLSDRIDTLIWPARNQKSEEAKAAWQEGTRLANEATQQVLDSRQRARLAEIVLWIQGTAALKREDIAQQLNLSEKQRKTMAEIQEATAAAIAEQYEKGAKENPATSPEKRGLALKQAEQRQILRVLTETQRQRWLTLVGKKVDVAKLGRITFSAPPLVATPTTWINGPDEEIEWQGRVTAVHFFANGCINCIRNYEHYKGWDRDFRKRGLTIIGIHTPETQAEHDMERLKTKVAEAGFQFPILIDNNRANWNAWGNSMWPSVYLIDRNGRIRYWWYGELNWQNQTGEQQLRSRIEELLSER